MSKEKVLKVSNLPQGKGYTPFIRIAGKYLNDFNFNVDDNVIVILKPNEITIKRAEQADLIQFLARKTGDISKILQ